MRGKTSPDRHFTLHFIQSDQMRLVMSTDDEVAHFFAVYFGEFGILVRNVKEIADSFVKLVKIGRIAFPSFL